MDGTAVHRKCVTKNNKNIVLGAIVQVLSNVYAGWRWTARHRRPPGVGSVIPRSISRCRPRVPRAVPCVPGGLGDGVDRPAGHLGRCRRSAGPDAVALHRAGNGRRRAARRVTGVRPRTRVGGVGSITPSPSVGCLLHPARIRHCPSLGGTWRPTVRSHPRQAVGRPGGARPGWRRATAVPERRPRAASGGDMGAVRHV